MNYHIWQHSKSEMLQNKASLTAVPALPWGCGSCSRAEGDSPSKWSVSKIKCCGHNIYYKGWVFPWNILFSYCKGSSRRPKKANRTLTFIVWSRYPSNLGAYWSGIDSSWNKWWTGVGLAQECKGGVIETSIHCFMGIEMVTQTLPLQLSKVTSFIAAVVYLKLGHLLCH